MEFSPTDWLLIGLITAFGLAAVIGALGQLLRKIFGLRETVPSNAIVVDGSNVMHWGGDPSVKVLKRVVQHLTDHDLQPHVIFDANVGYKLSDRYLDDAPMAKLIGLPAKQVLVVSKGQIADEAILSFASEHELRVVSNDRFRDWFVKHRWIKKRGRLVRGSFVKGALKMSAL